MPLTSKGSKIKEKMEAEYGAKKGESVFYASRNKGTISGVDNGTVTQPNAGIPQGRNTADDGSFSANDFWTGPQS